MKACPKNAEDVNSAQFWEENCMTNLNAACPTASPTANYIAFDFITYCIPNPTEDNTNILTELKQTFLDSEAGGIISDMAGTWKTMCVLLFTGMIIAIGFMWLMSNCARCLAMAGVAILLLSFFGGGAVMMFTGFS